MIGTLIDEGTTVGRLVCGEEEINALIAVRVLGPTAPYPVDAGSPLDTMLFLAWKALTLASVRIPK